ncbi:microtubule-associated tumor suppressor 1 homolog A isoform X2 [Myripristis murdjan]|uniref:Microtubule-associated tumor suppressor 1-like n=1 Tax=Myripristis murdjan TaxID=586833 RepID=A0A667ZV80_9TELE|nr:microtubule-associated tumor suppressor 1 homolog isoform X2 [Myripristis murdjan]
MSFKTFNISTENEFETASGSLPHSSLQLTLSSGNHYNSLSPHTGASSPDFSRSTTNLSDRDTSSPPDINMLECREDSPVGHFNTQTVITDTSIFTTSPNNNTLSGVTMNLNQTFITTPVNCSVNFWNENMTVAMNASELGLEEGQSFSDDTRAKGYNTVTFQDSTERDSQLNSCETSRRGSSENDCCFLSSGEMVMRSNSFCLEDQTLPIISSLEESSFSSPMSSAALPAEVSLVTATLPDVCEGIQEQRSPGGITTENAGPPCLGITFIQADDYELPTESNDMATSSSDVALPSEDEGALLRTFVYETTPSDFGAVALHSADSNPDASLLSCFPQTFTHEQGKTFIARDMKDAGKDVQTSTPVQSSGNRMLSLPSLSESPLAESAGTSAAHPPKQQQRSLTPKQRLVVRLPPSAKRLSKIEIKKFPKPDFSSVKSKIMTRPAQQQGLSGPASQHKSSQVNVHSKQAQLHRRAPVDIAHAKVRSSTNVAFHTTKTASDIHRGKSTGAANLATTLIQSSEEHRNAAVAADSLSVSLSTNEDGQEEKRASMLENFSAGTEHDSSASCCHARSKTEQAISNQVAAASAQHPGNQTFCFSSPGKTADRADQTDPKPSPAIRCLKKEDMCSTRTRPRSLSENSSSSSRLPKEDIAISSASSSFTVPKTYIQLAQSKPGNLNCPAQNKQSRQAEARRAAAETSREIRKISLVTESSKSRVGGAAGATNDESKRFQGWPSPRRVTGASACQPPPASSSLRPAPLSAKQRQGNLGNDECSTSKVTGSPQPKQKSTAASQRAQAPEEPSLRAPSATGNTRPLVNGSRPTPTPIRPSSMGPPSTPASRVPRQPQGRSRNLFVEASVHSEQSGGTGSSKVSGAATHRSTPLKTAVLKARLISSAGRNTGPTLVTACKSATPTTQGSSKSTASSLKRTSSRAVRLSSSVPVDKNKPKACFHQQQPQQQAAQPAQGNGPPDLVPADVTEDYRAQCERKDQSLQQLRGLLAASNCRFEATAVVLQQTLAERDEAMRQRRELSQELVTLKGELVCSLQSCERLEKEKEDLNVTLEETLQKLQEQHLKELEQLEQKLQAFYQAEWDKVHLTYQEEADKCKALLEQQMGELKANHEAMKLELKASHAEQLKCVKQQYEESLEELRKVHDQEQQSLDNMMKEAEAALSGQIQELMEENNALTEKLKAEDNRRKELAEKNLKDSHTLYLEQELESLKVVLDIKNKQLHQQEKKLMQMDKLTEKSVKLDESLKKVQQENEDLKARMDRHAALSRQLSTEQAVLQESLQKESKVNKRLSMENEELLWKLHNGDLSSPRKTSPTSPSHSLSLQSPRSSVFLSSPPVSPR